MRVIWKDTNGKKNKPVKYRKHFVSGYKGGWVTDLPGDTNVYKNHYCAMNAIDAALGDNGRKKEAKRLGYGIQIVGQKDE